MEKNTETMAIIMRRRDEKDEIYIYIQDTVQATRSRASKGKRK